MTRTIEIIRAMSLPPADFVRALLRRREAAPATDPRHSDVPLLRCAEIAAVYHSQRVAGDFYEFLRVGPSRVLFGLFDLAGRREDTREILIAAQNTFRTLAPRLFAGKDFNEAEAMVGLCHEVNRTILQVAGGIRSCPAFIGCYNEDLGFSHATQSASTCALGPGAALLLVSRGIVEAEHNDREFGLEGAKKSFQGASALSAQDLCLAVLKSAEQFLEAAPAHNDVTALVLLRYRDTDRPGSRSSGPKPYPYKPTGKRK
jgi:hypothetical protein